MSNNKYVEKQGYHDKEKIDIEEWCRKELDNDPYEQIGEVECLEERVEKLTDFCVKLSKILLDKGLTEEEFFDLFGRKEDIEFYNLKIK